MSSDLRKEFINGTIGALSIALFFLLFLPEIPTAGAQPGNNSPGNENPYMDAKLTPSMAIIIVVLIAAMFFMGFFSIYIRHCSRGGSGGGSIRAVVGAVAGRSRRARGLNAEALEALPTFAYSEVKGLKIGKGALECAVCLNEFDDDETLRLLPKCDHVFHAECIDAWFASHTTCPVCRANLAGEIAADVSDAQVSGADPNGLEDLEIVHDNRSETSELHNDDVVVPVAEDSDRNKESAILPPRPREAMSNRPARSWSMKKPRFFSKFPRSHSTGHSLVQPGENCERFTLRLPQGVRKQLVNRSMNRAAGLAMLPREGSSRRGYRVGGEGSSRGGRNYRRLDSAVKSDRWVLTVAPPFFSRASSLRSPKVAADGEGSSSSAVVTPRALLTAVKAPLTCLGSKAVDAESASAETARLPV